MDKAYAQGFMDKCATMGVDPEALLKFGEHYAEQDRPAETKKVYKALAHGKGETDMKKRYGSRYKEVAARIAEKEGG